MLPLISKLRWALALVILIGSGVAIWLIFGRAPQDDVWTQIQSTGVLRVGADASYPPFEDLDSGGQIVGFDVDFANEIAHRLNLKTQFVNIAYDGLFDALITGRVDVLISALADLPQAAGKAAFTLPYFNAGETLVVNRNSSIYSMQDMEGRTLAVEYGSGGDVLARQWQRRLSKLTVNRYPDPDTALSMVLKGEADGALVDGIAARLGVGHHPELALSDQVDDTLFAIATKTDSRELRQMLNQTIQAVNKDGTINRLVEKWFGPQMWMTQP